MTDTLLALTRVPWRWDWVPCDREDEAEREAWTAHVAALYEEWTRDSLAAARAGWDPAGGEFPLAPDTLGRTVAQGLLERADRLSEPARLVWGVAFVDGKPRWAPVPVVVEFGRPRDADPTYLMDSVGSKGRDGDAREPVVDYVTTPAGDGLRVFAFARTEQGAAYGRLDAALRLDVPPNGGAAAVSVDVLLSTRVFEVTLMGVIGPGVEQLMQWIAAECVPAADGTPARLRFAAAEGAAS
jgi:hypothetical protein